MNTKTLRCVRSRSVERAILPIRSTQGLEPTSECGSKIGAAHVVSCELVVWGSAYKERNRGGPETPCDAFRGSRADQQPRSPRAQQPSRGHRRYRNFQKQSPTLADEGFSDTRRTWKDDRPARWPGDMVVG